MITNFKIEKVGKWWFDPTRYRAECYFNDKLISAYGGTSKAAVRDLFRRMASSLNKNLTETITLSEVR